jgi:hypothetical protein
MNAAPTNDNKYYSCGCPREFDDIRALSCLSTKRWDIVDNARRCGHAAYVVYEYIKNNDYNEYKLFVMGDYSFARAILTDKQYIEFLEYAMSELQCDESDSGEE